MVAIDKRRKNRELAKIWLLGLWKSATDQASAYVS